MRCILLMLYIIEARPVPFSMSGADEHQRNKKNEPKGEKGESVPAAKSEPKDSEQNEHHRKEYPRGSPARCTSTMIPRIATGVSVGV